MAKRASLASKLKGVKVSEPVPNEPVWRGPSDPDGGVTQSLLGRFLVCRERFRLLVVKGLQTADAFEPRIEYGNLWHTCEEAIARHKPWEQPLKEYAQQLAKRYPTQQEQIDKWYNVCKVQFPVYMDYWKKHPDVVKRKPLLEEVSFRIPYLLPSGRVVWLRGKWDSVDYLPKSGRQGERIVLQENKTKSEINTRDISRTLLFDIQTMMYLAALEKLCEYAEHGAPDELMDQAELMYPEDVHWGGLDYGKLSNRPRTVRYNVIRRPLSGGAGTIRPHKAKKNKPAETLKEYYARLQGLIVEAPDTYFARWEVSVTGKDIETFEKRFLQPCLEGLCDWWEFMEDVNFDPWLLPRLNPWTRRMALHWQHPFNVYNSINETGYSDLDENLLNGSTVGLQRVDNLFPELA